MIVHCRNNKGFKWYSIQQGDDILFVKGYLYNEYDKLFDNKKLLDYFIDVDSWIAFEKKLNRANGFFLVVKKIQTGWLVGVDRLRSMPIFYTHYQNELSISDDAFYLASQIEKIEIDQEQRASFLLAGFTLDNQTLIKGIQQLEAGQFLFFNNKDIIIKNYFVHLRKELASDNYEKQISELHDISVKIFKRLINWAKGRQLVIPLSGGYDSRYIVSMLHTLNYRNVVCYTYGIPTSFEVNIARKVAEKLDYIWHYIEYSKDWNSYYECKEYQIFASQFSSLPHEQDFLAVKELKEKKLIQDDAIFLPGFCGDLLGGSMIPDFYQKNFKIRKGQLQDYIFDTQFSYENKVDKSNEKKLKKSIIEKISEIRAIKSINDFISVNELFFTQNYVSKYVVNANRIFEYFGHEWSMPLWDNELMDWWYQIPNEQRVGDRKLYDKFLLNEVFSKQSIDFKKTKKRTPKYQMQKILGKSLMKWGRVAYINSPFYNDLNSTIPLLKLYQKDLKRARRDSLISTKPNKIMAAWTLMFLEKEIKQNGN